MTGPCLNCAHGEVHGFPPEGTPDWVCFTVSFFCPLKKRHDLSGCELWEQGEPKEVRDDLDGGL